MDTKNTPPHSGFSLTELMIVVGVMGIVMMGSMRLFQDAFKTQTRVEAGQDSILLTDQLAKILNDAPTCTSLIKGTKSANNSQLVLGTALYEGARVGRITVTGLKLNYVSELTDDVYMAKVWLSGEKTSDGTGGFNRELPLVYRVDEREYITECLGDNFGAQSNCKVLGGKWDAKLRECDLCGALGGESNARGRCQLAGTPISACPFQKTFSANSTRGVCADQWDANFISDSISYLSSFSHVSADSISWYKRDLQKALSNPPKDELPAKLIGGRKEASWVVNMEPQNEVSGRPCSTLVYLKVNCP